MDIDSQPQRSFSQQYPQSLSGDKEEHYSPQATISSSSLSSASPPTNQQPAQQHMLVFAQSLTPTTPDWHKTDLGNSWLRPAVPKRTKEGLTKCDVEHGETFLYVYPDHTCCEMNYPQTGTMARGTLYLTSYKVLFKPSLEDSPEALIRYFTVPYGFLWNVVEKTTKTQ